jgi:hypothetical protein
LSLVTTGTVGEDDGIYFGNGLRVWRESGGEETVPIRGVVRGLKAVIDRVADRELETEDGEQKLESEGLGVRVEL